jgi:magnesium chelatase subunit D
MAYCPPYPFIAIVGQERMQQALILNAISSSIGGVLIRGERGTAKSTAARALAALLPEIEAVADCPFSCDPRGVAAMCDDCRARFARGEALPAVRRRAAFVNLPVSATEDRVVGTLDIERAIQHGQRRFEPGVLAAANRGLLYIDEVNLLDDHVVDLLLDAAAMGVNIVEREGISFSHPARFILVGTMNPEEGELRPQLLDRFALCVEMHGILDPHQRVQIIERRMAYEQDPESFCQEWQLREAAISQAITAARARLAQVTYTQADLFTIAQLATSFKVDGHRADIVMLKTARAHAAWAGRPAISTQDIMLAAELALPHRLKRRPFEEAALEPGAVADRLRELRRQSPSDVTAAAPSQQSTAAVTGSQPRAEPAQETQQTGSSSGSTTPDVLSHPPGAAPTDKRAATIGASFQVRRLSTPLDRLTRQAAGKRSFTLTARKRGRYVRARPMEGRPDDLAFDATLRTAAPFQRRRRAERSRRRLAFVIKSQDLQRKVRVRRTANLVLFVVDASWSMATEQRVEATRGAVLSLLHDAYRRRDQVGLIVFRGETAELVLPPTTSVELALRRLRHIPVGGKTPLSAALLLALQVCTAARRRNPEVLPLVIFLTDGAGNMSLSDLPAQDEAWRIAGLLRRSHLRALVLNMEEPSHDVGLAQRLAAALGGPCHTLPEVNAATLVKTVRQEVRV